MSALPETPARRRLRRFALAAVVTNLIIVVTGASVRVTGSGLGCPTWPSCDGERLVPSAEHGWHGALEFGNRLLTFPVLAAAVAVVVWLYLTRPHPPALMRFAWVLPIGVAGQVLLGGITVLSGLTPITVAGHFLLSMVLILAAVTVHEMSRPGREREPRVGPSLRHLTTAVAIVGLIVLVLGTVTTSAGPHGGDVNAPRLDLDIRLAALAHADAVWLLLGLTVALVLVTWRLGPSRLRAAARALLAIVLLQGAIGYTQYALGVPEPLVILHVAGAAAMWATASAAWIRARPELGARPDVSGWSEPDEAGRRDHDAESVADAGPSAAASDEVASPR